MQIFFETQITQIYADCFNKLICVNLRNLRFKKLPAWKTWQRHLAACFLLLSIAVAIQAQDGEWLDRTIRLKQAKSTRYQLLKHISEQTGYLFVYDSRVLDNDAAVQVQKGEYTLRDAIYTAAGNRNLQLSLVGNNHIVLSLPVQTDTSRPLPATVSEKRYFTITGTVYDLFSKETISSATVSISGVSIGTVTNREGRFRMTLSDSLLLAMVRISHIGYESLEFKASDRAGMQSDFVLEPKVIPLQEVVVRVVDPRHTLEQMLERRSQNYYQQPVALTAFYREGIEHKKRNVDLTEVVLKVYKPAYDQAYLADQVQLVKMRRILDKQERDTILTRVKSGIHSALLLDVVRNIPDFLDPDHPDHPFVYTHTDIAVVDDRLANVISFEQRKGVKEPLYKGELFIDTDNHALLEARFRVNPEHVEKATALFVEKRSRNHKLTLRDAGYVVTYKPLANGKYCINYVHGELEFRVRRKHQWISSTLRVWFELVNCKVDTENVQPIPRAERMSPRTVLSETKHPYDAGFWEHFNVILPESELKELIINNLNEIVELP